MKTIMGFEFNKSTAKDIRKDDMALKVLSSLQENGIAKMSRTGYEYLCDSFKDCEGEYWSLYCNDRESEVVLVSHQIHKIHEV